MLAHTYAMRTVDDEPLVTRIPMPEDIENPTGMVGALLSPDGTTVVIGQDSNQSRTVWMTSLTDASESWTPMPGYPAFIVGTDT